MNNNQFEKYKSIPAEKFALATGRDVKHDSKLETKPIGYLQDAFNRFRKNKSSVIAAIIILFLVVYALVGPFLIHSNYVDAYQTDTDLKLYKELSPRLSFFAGSEFWGGTKTMELTDRQLARYQGIALETGNDPIVKELKTYTVSDLFLGDKTMHKVRIDQYYALGVVTKVLTKEQYEAIQTWQDESGIQVILPVVNSSNTLSQTEPSYWFKCNQKGDPELDAQGNFQPDYVVLAEGKDDGYHSKRLASDPANKGEQGWAYATVTGAEGRENYLVRICTYNYFQYKFGYEPSFAFGTDSKGYDIFTRLASGARFSFLLAIIVSAINLTIGTIYGAIEGYYGGVTDMIMERISDILSGVPFTVVTVLFQLHLAAKVGVVGSLIYAFVLTGWIGMASRVRMQFYRFKNQEYVLAARTLGAKDSRIIWKHIFPNTLGTLITGTILVIPGVIFSETSLSYLGIINLDSPTLSSVGSMLSAGQKVMTSAPHVVFFPAIFIALLEISFNLFGNGLRDAFNPSLRGTEE